MGVRVPLEVHRSSFIRPAQRQSFIIKFLLFKLTVKFCDVGNNLIDPNKLMGIFTVNKCFKLFRFTISCVGAKDCGNNIVLYSN